VAELLRLIDEVDTVDMKNKLAACLNTILDRSKTEVFSSFRSYILVDLWVVQIAPSVSLITSTFPQLCKLDLLIIYPGSYSELTKGLSAAGESHFKITLLRMMTALITVSSAVPVMNIH
jgi:hypothetical protein